MTIERFVTIRIWVKTRKLLKKISAETGESMVKVLERLTQIEWVRLEEENKEEK